MSFAFRVTSVNTWHGCKTPKNSSWLPVYRIAPVWVRGGTLIKFLCSTNATACAAIRSNPASMRFPGNRPDHRVRSMGKFAHSSLRRCRRSASACSRSVCSCLFSTPSVLSRHRLGARCSKNGLTEFGAFGGGSFHGCLDVIFPLPRSPVAVLGRVLPTTGCCDWLTVWCDNASGLKNGVASRGVACQSDFSETEAPGRAVSARRGLTLVSLGINVDFNETEAPRALPARRRVSRRVTCTELVLCRVVFCESIRSGDAGIVAARVNTWGGADPVFFVPVVSESSKRTISVSASVSARTVPGVSTFGTGGF